MTIRKLPNAYFEKPQRLLIWGYLKTETTQPIGYSYGRVPNYLQWVNKFVWTSFSAKTNSTYRTQYAHCTAGAIFDLKLRLYINRCSYYRRWNHTKPFFNRWIVRFLIMVNNYRYKIHHLYTELYWFSCPANVPFHFYIRFVFLLIATEQSLHLYSGS